MTEIEYLKALHALTERFIGAAILHLKDGNYGHALHWLEDCRTRIDNLEKLKKPVDTTAGNRAHEKTLFKGVRPPQRINRRMKMERSSEQTLLQELQQSCDDIGLREFCRRHGLNAGYVCHVLKGRKPPQKKICNALGYDVTTFRIYTKRK